MQRALLLGLMLLPAASFAQSPPLTVPEPSPRASVQQRVGLTDVTITYNRPAVNGRKVWGGLVPFGQVWRAGANDNTKITFSTQVSLDGKKLAAGTYGLHLIPTQSTWTVIFSNVNTMWGSFGYDEKEDALRLTATPETATQVERLQYTIDEPTGTEAIVALRWEKLRLPFKVSVDTPALVMESVRRELRGLPQFFPKAWSDAAGIGLSFNGNLDEAMTWADKSLKLQPTFEGQMVKAALLEKKGDSAAAGPLRDQALAAANENQVNLYAYGLLQQGKTEKAVEIFRRNVKARPESWNVYDSLAEALQKAGDNAAAKEAYEKARSLVKDAVQKARIERTLTEMK